MNLFSNTITLRFVELSDAEFIHSLRTDEKYNKHLSLVDNNVLKQKEWLRKYKEREKLSKEYYFIILRKLDQLPIGTVRVYDFIEEENSFCWGSWILNENKTRYAALECALLIYDFAFIKLRFNRCHMDIRKQNTKVIKFHERFGVKIVGETELDLLGHYFLADYLKIRDEIKNFIDNNSNK
jgi:RimJ/RimL family protein N-acetyltransferase